MDLKNFIILKTNIKKGELKRRLLQVHLSLFEFYESKYRNIPSNIRMKFIQNISWYQNHWCFPFNNIYTKYGGCTCFFLKVLRNERLLCFYSYFVL